MEPNNFKNDYLTFVKCNWLETSSSFPTFLFTITNEKKRENEIFLQKLTSDLQNQAKTFPQLSFKRKAWKKQTLQLINEALFCETMIHIHKYLDEQTMNLFQQELTEFLIQVRTFSPELSFDQIGQALRNYIVYIMFKLMNQVNTGLNKACFAYSMLYPFTDNYIDSSNYSKTQKSNYNQMIRDKLKGKMIIPSTIYEQKTCQLLQEIENYYPRDKNPQIYSLLLMMLEAQEDSLRQQNTKIELSLQERLDISLYKGGVSVLIDYYFVDKEITQDDLYFYLAFGFFLQLADDLQDIRTDSIQGNQTMFTINLNHEHEEAIVNKMLHFISHIIQSYHAPNNELKNFLLSNCYQLIFMSVAENMEYFSKEYLNHLEQYFLISFPFYETLKKDSSVTQDTKTHKKYIKILDEILLHD